MNFEEFKQQLMDDLKQMLSARTGSEVSVEANQVQKLQQESYDGIIVKKDNLSIGVNLDITRYYSDLEHGRSYQDVLHSAINAVEKGFDEAPRLDISQLMNYEVMKHHLITQLIPVAGNEDMLAVMPYKQIEDLALVYRFKVGSDEFGQATILVKNDLLRRLDITAEQIFEDAMISSPKEAEPSLRNMFEVTAELAGEDLFELLGEVDSPVMQMYVCTNKSTYLGASVLMYPGMMDIAADKLGGDFYVIPSSIHETLLIPAKDVDSFRDLEKMVREVNETQVAPEERLSDNVYHYDAKERVFELAQHYEERVAGQERDSDGRDSVLKDLSAKSKEVAQKTPKENSAPKKSRAEESL